MGRSSSLMSKTLEVKLAELAPLSQFFKKPIKTPMVAKKDINELLQHKNFLMRELRAQAYREHTFANTNVGKLSCEWYGFKFFQRYSRQGDPLVGESICKQIYPVAPAALKAHGFFLSSGQAATLTALVVLVSKLKLGCESKQIRAYFESVDLLQSLPKSKAAESFLFFDSSALNFSWDSLASADPKKILLFDTTCIDRQDAHLAEFLSQIHKTRRPAILVRSCLKLDTFGAEYGTLGNLLILNPEEFPHKKVQDVVKSVGAVLGHFSSIDAVYPFLTHEDITNLNSLRVGRIQANNRILTEHLQEKGIQVRVRPHHLFCELTSTDDGNPVPLQRLAKKIFKVTNYPIHFADSFGLDIAGVTTYADFYDPQGRAVLRLIPPDFVEDDFRAHLHVYDQIVGRFHG